jgi:hypothetical protein
MRMQEKKCLYRISSLQYVLGLTPRGQALTATDGRNGGHNVTIENMKQIRFINGVAFQSLQEMLQPLNAHYLAIVVCCHNEEGIGETVDLVTDKTGNNDDPIVVGIRNLLIQQADRIQ